MRFIQILFITLFCAQFGNGVAIAKQNKSEAEHQKATLILGGGCAETLRKEMAAEANQYAEVMSQRGWQVWAAFGGRAETFDNSKDFVPPKNNPSERTLPLTKKSVLMILKNLSGTLKKGDSFLFHIITHGAYADQGHAICLGNQTSMNLNHPILHQYLNQMKKNGVKISVIDNSCYGGQSLELFSKYGCVLSTQSGDFPSTAEALRRSKPEKLKFGIGSILRQQLQQTDSKQNPASSLNLEDVFLLALLDYDHAFIFPQMSGAQSVNRIGGLAAYRLFDLSQRLDAYQDSGPPEISLNEVDSVDGVNDGSVPFLKQLERFTWFNPKKHKHIPRLEQGRGGLTVASDLVRKIKVGLRLQQDRSAQIEQKNANINKRFAESAYLFDHFSQEVLNHSDYFFNTRRYSKSLISQLESRGCEKTAEEEIRCRFTFNKNLVNLSEQMARKGGLRKTVGEIYIPVLRIIEPESSELFFDTDFYAQLKKQIELIFLDHENDFLGLIVGHQIDLDQRNKLTQESESAYEVLTSQLNDWRAQEYLSKIQYRPWINPQIKACRNFKL